MQLSLGQMDICLGDPGEFFERVRALTKEAARLGSTLVEEKSYADYGAKT